MWNRIWNPVNGEMGIGGFFTEPKKVSFMDGTEIKFEKIGDRMILKNLPAENPDKILGIPLIKFEFDCEPEYRFASYFPQLNGGLSREIK